MPRVNEHGTAVTSGPSSNRLVLKYGVLGPRNDEVPAGIEPPGSGSRAKVAHLPPRLRLNDEHLPSHLLSSRVLRGESGLKLLRRYACFGALLPSHFGSIGAIDLNEVFLAGPTR